VPWALTNLAAHREDQVDHSQGLINKDGLHCLVKHLDTKRAMLLLVLDQILFFFFFFQKRTISCRMGCNFIDKIKVVLQS